MSGNICMLILQKITESTVDIQIIIIKGFWTNALIFIFISTIFRSICPPAFFRCLLNMVTYTELRTMSSIESTGSPVLILLAITVYKC